MTEKTDFLAILKSQVQSCAENLGISNAQYLACAVETRIKQCLGGNMIYVPKHKGAEETAALHKAIRAEYDGRNLQKVAAKHGVCAATVHYASRRKATEVQNP